MDERTKVFYDGHCAVCSREMEHYRQLDKENKLQLIDYTAPDFHAEKFGLDPKKITQAMHVIDPSGKILVGVDSFIALWNQFPRYRLLTRLAQTKRLRPFFDFGYKIFAHYIRPHLPRRQCHDGSCKLK